jgi:class 3 adenylate cyclase/tetratricopeptide (TPR) repeat protein
VLRPGARFCDGCGHPTGAGAAAAGDAAPAPGTAPRSGERDPRSYTPRHLVDRILTQKATLEGERRHVTVLFADVAGYTALAERADPEAMHVLMDRCFRRILDEVHRYEGTVNQFTGDGVMALFGAPLALEDAPRRAVLAALAIQRTIVPLDEEVQSRYGRRFAMRIGIHSGPVVVGRIGDDLRMDYTAVGDTTNLAARLQALGPPGGVLISESTRQLVAGFFELRDAGTQPVKGKSKPVHAFEVLSERAVSGRIEAAAETGLTPLVGREPELAALRAAFESARDGRGQVAFVVGEAGIGKSRLLYEFRRRLDDEPHTWFEARCSAYANTAAFYAVSDGVRRLFGIDDRDDEAQACAKLERREADLGGELAWTLPFVRGLLALPLGDAAVEAMDPLGRRSETVRALQAHFLRAAVRQPLVLVVEDLHWIDAASEELLGFLAESTPTARALLLFTYRPGYRHPFGDRSYHVRIAPQPLSAQAMHAMTRSLLESASLPSELLELIAAKAEGNPFFVEEVTKSLLEEGVLRRTDGGAELARALAEVTVPDSIQDVLMARLDRLADEPRRAIQVASVIGREFALRLLAQIREAGDRVQDVVGELRALELIYEKAAHPELAFMFKHALTHDVAYDSILVARRRTLHGIVGTAIEKIYGDRLPEHYAALAHHFERSQDWERAFEYHERAARHAADEYANRSVIEHCRRALAIAEHLADVVGRERRAALQERLGEAHQCLSEYAPAGEAFLAAAEASDDPGQAARQLGRAAHSLIWAHRYDEGKDLGVQALSRARACGDPAAEALAHVALDLLEVATLGPRGRLDIGMEAVEIAERSDSLVARGLALCERAISLQHLGDFRSSIEYGNRALATCQKAPSDVALALVTISTKWSLSIALTALGRYRESLALLQDGLELSDRCGDRVFKGRILNTLGWTFAEIGCHERARVYNQQAEEIAAELTRLEFMASAPEVHANAAINLANNYTALGECARAFDHLDPVREAVTGSSDPWAKWRWSLHVFDAQARLAVATGRPERALVHLDAELAGARQHRARKVEARALELRGRALIAMDDRDAAEATLRGALQVAEEIEYPPVLWRTESLLAEIARRRGDRAEAERLDTAVRRRIADLSRPIEDAGLARGFRAMADVLVSDPLGAYR